MWQVTCDRKTNSEGSKGVISMSNFVMTAHGCQTSWSYGPYQPTRITSPLFLLVIAEFRFRSFLRKCSEASRPFSPPSLSSAAMWLLGSTGPLCCSEVEEVRIVSFWIHCFHKFGSDSSGNFKNLLLEIKRTTRPKVVSLKWPFMVACSVLQGGSTL